MTPLERLGWLVELHRQSWASRNARAVATTIAHRAGSNGAGCYLGLDGLASETGVSRRGVMRALAALTERGWLDKEPGGGRGRATVYRPTFPAEKQGHSYDPVSGSETGTQTGSFRAHKQGHSYDPPTGQQLVTTPPTPPCSPADENASAEPGTALARGRGGEVRNGKGGLTVPTEGELLPRVPDPRPRRGATEHERAHRRLDEWEAERRRERERDPRPRRRQRLTRHEQAHIALDEWEAELDRERERDGEDWP